MRFWQLDVFSPLAWKGNPLAVVADADGMTDQAMQDFARWTNLSETLFFVSPDIESADYRVRIFTPKEELEFAGHPTLGAAFAWHHLLGSDGRRRNEYTQQCRLGLVSVKIVDDIFYFKAPTVACESAGDELIDRVVQALGVTTADVVASQWLSVGTRWLVLQLRNAGAVLDLEPNHSALKSLPWIGVIGRHLEGRECLFEVRAFVDPIGVPEDPVTGSLNGALAQWLIQRGVAPRRYIAAQGTKLGRVGRVHIDADEKGVWVGANVSLQITGLLRP